jgi:hypothetical protein
MRTFIGMVMGCLLTVAVVYFHDMSATSTVSAGTTVSDTRTIVNWDVASRKWGEVTDNAKHAWARLRENLS